MAKETDDVGWLSDLETETRLYSALEKLTLQSLTVKACLQAPGKAPRTAQAGSQGPKQGSRQGISRATGVRCLAIMEQVAAAVQDAGMGLQLADAMLPLLNQKGGSRWGRRCMSCST